MSDPRSALRFTVDKAKVLNYLLNLEHPDGAGKAQFFLARGFSGEEWEEFAQSLRAHGASQRLANILAPTQYGQTFVVECELPTPDAMNPCVLTVWSVDDTTIDEATDARLVTSYPAG